ncbi:MAG: dipeptidase [Myxococcota bacterium]|nr:dipeptidase [Myxococcota bacterium]
MKLLCDRFLPALLSIGLGGCSATPLDVHRDAIVIDTHSDTTTRFEREDWDFSERHPRSDSHMDLPRIREGGLDVQFWSIYTGKAEAAGEALAVALRRIDAVHRLIERHPDEIGLATTVGEIRDLVAQGKLASLMGVEGGHMIEDDLAVLRAYYRLGVRYMTLTHSFHTRWADSSGTSTIPEPVHGGLAPFGEEVVLEMNRLGMMVDVSHVSDETFFDAIRVSRAPVIASHSSCRAIADHTRNMSDDMLRALADNGGVIMINFYPAYIDEVANRETRAYFGKWRSAFEGMREEHSDDPSALYQARRAHFAEHPVPQTSLDVLLDHFEHAIRVAGADHVGIGADWDGVPSMPSGMDDISALPRLTEGLLARGQSPEIVRKVLGENLLRVMGEVEVIARQGGASY